MPLKKSPDFEAYFKFLADFFALFPALQAKPRRPMTGEHFKL